MAVVKIEHLIPRLRVVNNNTLATCARQILPAVVEHRLVGLAVNKLHVPHRRSLRTLLGHLTKVPRFEPIL